MLYIYSHLLGAIEVETLGVGKKLEGVTEETDIT